MGIYLRRFKTGKLMVNNKKKRKFFRMWSRNNGNLRRITNFVYYYLLVAIAQKLVTETVDSDG